jgi:predicted GNAT family acetyltransferase
MTDSTNLATSDTDEIEVLDNPAESRYEARRGEDVLGVVDYRLDPDGGIVLVHTGVMPEAKGMGVGTRLAKGALDDIRAKDVKLTIECPFIAAYIRRHRGDYADLIDR